MTLVYILIRVEIENDARITFQSAAQSPHGPGELLGATGSRSSPRSLRHPPAPATAYGCPKPGGFALQPGRCCQTLTKGQGSFGGHAGKDWPCLFPGGNQFLIAWVRFMDQKTNSKKFVTYGKQNFAGFIIFRVTGTRLLLGNDPAQSCGECRCYWKRCPEPWGTREVLWSTTSPGKPPAWPSR